MASEAFQAAMAKRRTFYQLEAQSPISDERIQEIVHNTILHVPSSFNSQTTRVVLLLKEEHVALWDITKEVLKSVVPAEGYKATEQKLNGFQGAYGSILFYDHRPTIQEFQDKYKTYADKFPLWAAETNGMHQYAIWTALELEGLGCNLQHYNPLIDQKIAAKWDIPADWELKSQLVFGKPVGEAGPKTFKKVEGERLLIFGN